MRETKAIHKDYLSKATEINDIIHHFETKGEPFGNQDRNALKLFVIDDKTVNVKSFKVPNLINKIAYKFFRKSKAQRSFEYAKQLQNLNIGTPQPIAYYEYKSLFLFNKSYYISEQLDCDLTYRELTTDLDYPNHDAILRAFTRFTYKLHQNHINFLDHSPGNTLIKNVENGYEFFLVDLNRMAFKTMIFEDRIKNFAKLTTHKSMVEVMSDEYAKCCGKEKIEVFNLMWQYTQEFQNRYKRKRQLKKKLKFWKKS